MNRAIHIYMKMYAFLTNFNLDKQMNETKKYFINFELAYMYVCVCMKLEMNNITNCILSHRQNCFDICMSVASVGVHVCAPFEPLVLCRCVCVWNRR